MRRAVDVAVATAGIVVLSPLLGFIAVCVRVTTGSPVLFRQLRSGWHGRPFTILKFRTMRAPRYEGEPDASRITAVGRRLRAWSLDELPQLWNVLRGDMSLIGPRPTLPEQVVHYSPHQRRRLEVRPGLTGYAQVQGRNSLPWPDRIDLDIWYIDNRSLALDLRIGALTVLQLLRRDGITGQDGVNPGFPLPEGGETPSTAPGGAPSPGRAARMGPDTTGSN